VVDVGSDGEELVVNRPGARVVLRDTRLEQLEERLRGDAAVADEHAVNVERGVEEVFVVAGEAVDVGALTADDRDLAVLDCQLEETFAVE
jgi:hypothetical protein